MSGDESALDMFSWKGKGSSNMKIMNTSLGNAEALNFFIGGQNGSVYYLNEAGNVRSGEMSIKWNITA